ncbi:phosphoserine transaminase [Campylobacter pinnipediorum subsp. pinnipediorum]|uniref:Phosphoserine aminotransferase n=1 Tax=Campylobacter pinnipediorum subsp. pinnipediorum TaxID=1660067 RepID=A0AAX0L9D3_9BACT|nr:phosphoserine transaminase [Campylobacter pinnipediorum]AQW85047.1 phosphohydroxythreonine aminotransferase / 3-phosphoserine aminotransferase [Campylobacter pinnipediorum subsp. pinnipediorum]OPA76434.1 phosphoserine transaminase [Campylobacter pinnipediorum subsp. pinnipediorum]
MRMINFSAGPTGLPFEVLQKAQSEFVNYHNEGYSIMEISHRSKTYEEVHFGAMQKIRELYNISDDFEILFLQGGAHLQFSMIPLNLYQGGVAEYVDTGVWTSKAIKEAQILGINHKVVASSKDDNFNHIPDINFDDNADFSYICSNNTIYGTQYKSLPKSKAPLVVDSSSDFFSRPLDFSDIGILYGGAQKNAGPSGVTIVIIRKDLIDRVSSNNVPMFLRYKTHADAKSLYNTPPTFAIYLLNLNMQWLIDRGGLKATDQINTKKAEILYSVIDSSYDFYIGHAKKEDRSVMNVSFNIKNKDLEPIFVSEALKNNMLGLKGHRHLGGIRASIYNAVSVEDVSILADFMKEFARKNG